MGHIVSYDLTSYLSDPEGGALNLTYSGTYPFISISKLVVKLAPSYSIMAENITVKFKVSDGVNSIIISFKV